MQLPINYDSADRATRRQARLAYVELQGGRCWHCHTDLDGSPSVQVCDAEVNASLFPQGFFKYPVHLHHDHDTGETIGAVHNRCNAVLWQHHGK